MRRQGGCWSPGEPYTPPSWGWATLFALALPRRHTVAMGLIAGLAVAALDLGLVGRRYPRLRAQPPAPQIADHLPSAPWSPPWSAGDAGSPAEASPSQTS